MKLLLLTLSLAISTQSHAGIFGPGKEEKRCRENLISGAAFDEKGAKKICQNKPSADVISCTVRFVQQAQVASLDSFVLCNDGIKYQSYNFAMFQDCIVTLNGTTGIYNARNSCLSSPNAHMIQAPPAPVTTNPVATNPGSNDGIIPGNLNPVVTTPDSTQVVGPLTTPIVDPVGNMFPSLPDPGVAPSDSQNPAQATPPMVDPLNQGKNYQDLVVPPTPN